MGKELISRALPSSDLPETYRSADGAVIDLDRSVLEFAAAPAESDDPRIEAMLDSLGKIKALAAGQGAQVLVVLVPSKEELFGLPSQVAAANIVAGAKERLLQAGYPVVDLYPPLRRAGAAEAVFFPADIHLNQMGNRLAAEALDRWLRTHGFGQGG